MKPKQAQETIEQLCWKINSEQTDVKLSITGCIDADGMTVFIRNSKK